MSQCKEAMWDYSLQKYVRILSCLARCLTFSLLFVLHGLDGPEFQEAREQRPRKF
jgi:hypothetical protein